MQTQRLESGGRIDRDQLIHFSFDRRSLQGYRGDTLASALLANNISLVARSLKYHRPRGILAAGLEEPCALVSCADEYGVFIPNLKASEVRLSANLRVRSQNCWPTLTLDVFSLLQVGAALMSAGFYYKTFMWPRKWWFRVYEKLIRRVAGQGRVSITPDSKHYDKRFLNCEVLIVGSGETGLSEALKAAETSSSVLLIEQDYETGGSTIWERGQINACSAQSWLERQKAELKKHPNIRIMVNTLAFGLYDHGLVLAVEKTYGALDAIFWRIRAKRLVLATGNTEQPLLFAGNDRPGIMLAAAVRQYIYRYAVRPGNRAFLAIADSHEGDLTATALEYAGVDVVGRLGPGDNITATRGWHRLKGIDITDSEGRLKKIACDLMCVSSGWIENTHLDAQMGEQAMLTKLPVGKKHGGGGKQFVDLQNDVTASDLELAVREGYDHIELAKRYTTIGMGTDQGKTSWRNASVEMSRLLGREVGEIGHTTIRPPFSPVSFGALVGADRGIDMMPVRRTPFHSEFEKLGCVFQTSGDWLYSRYFAAEGESMQESICREVLAVRNAVGCVDMSTLGKVDVKGRDALKFLSRIYCNNIESIKPGRLRYVLMLREDGLLYDDGTLAQLGKDHFLATMTSANATTCWRWMNKMRQLQWPDLDVQLTLVSDHWASLAIAGPAARSLLQDLDPDFDVDKTSFPFAAVRSGQLSAKLPCRVFTASFSGELSYEINVPAGFAAALMQKVLSSGLKYGITPYGLEALDILRIEKGHISVGTEIDGRTTPADLGLARLVSDSKDFIGASLLQRPALQQPDRQQLVGLTPVDRDKIIPAAAILTNQSWQPGKVLSSLGKLTATIKSPTLGYSIALAMLQNGRQRYNERLWAVSPVTSQSIEVVIGPHCFFDTEGSRLHE